MEAFIAEAARGFSNFEAGIITGCLVIIALCYLLSLFNGYRGGPGPRV